MAAVLPTPSRRSRSQAPLFAGKWVIERVLGHGGMGIVYAARHGRLGHRVALKVLGEGLREHPELVTRFEREARAASALTSIHAVKVFDIDMTENRTPFLVMELLEGLDLARLLDRDGAQPVGRSARWILEACDAIAEAHRRGIVHRDIKPSNLFLAQQDDRVVVKVLDFGIAKRLASKGREAALTGDIAPLGTPHYMSPEQIRCAKDVDARSDVWSLGVTLFELVTGEPPYTQVEPSACIAAIAADPVRDPRVLRPELPEPFVDVVMRALAKDPAARFANAEELAAALAPFVELDPELEQSAVVRLGSARSKPRLLLEPTMHELDDVASVPSPEEPAPPSPLPIVGPDLLGPVRAMRPAFGSEQTVPPAISFGGEGSSTRGRRIRRALAVAGAAALFATMILPKCVGHESARAQDVALTNAAVAPAPRPVPPPAAAVPARVAPDSEPARGETALVREVTDVAEKPVAPATTAAKPVVRKAPAPAASSKRTSNAHGIEIPPASARPPSVASSAADTTEGLSTPVHGGLRGPGF